jgi:hypothetical protein
MKNQKKKTKRKKGSRETSVLKRNRTVGRKG